MKGMKKKTRGVPPGSPGTPGIGKALPAERKTTARKGRKRR